MQKATQAQLVHRHGPLHPTGAVCPHCRHEYGGTPLGPCGECGRWWHRPRGIAGSLSRDDWRSLSTWVMVGLASLSVVAPLFLILLVGTGAVA